MSAKVYVVSKTIWDSSWVLGVFSTRQKAIEAITNLRKHDGKRNHALYYEVCPRIVNAEQVPDASHDEVIDG